MSGVRYDTIVVGAGPAGSSAARALSTAGQKVLLLDIVAFPRGKPCGGLMAVRAGRLFELDGKAAIARQFESTLVRIGPHAVDTVREPVMLVERREFDHALLARAEQAGAEFRVISGVASVADAGGVVLTTRDGEVLRAASLIGCDGSSSAVARSIGVVRRGARPYAVVADVPLDRCPPALVDRPPFFDFLAVDGGYGWTFAKATHLSIGTYGVQPVRALKIALQAFADAEGVPLPATFAAAAIETRPVAVPAGVRSVLLAGDAAGLGDHFTGGGLHSALLSGRLAARAVLEAEGGDAVTLYGALLRPLHDVLARQRAVARLVHRVVPTPRTFADLVLEASAEQPPEPTS